MIKIPVICFLIDLIQTIHTSQTRQQFCPMGESIVTHVFGITFLCPFGRSPCGFPVFERQTVTPMDAIISPQECLQGGIPRRIWMLFNESCQRSEALIWFRLGQVADTFPQLLCFTFSWRFISYPNYGYVK